MKSRVRRLEEENQKKEKEIEQLLDPSKSEEMRRTLADKKPDAGVVMQFGNVFKHVAHYFYVNCDYFWF